MFEWLSNLLNYLWNLSDDWLKTGLIIAAIVQGAFFFVPWALSYREAKNEKQPQAQPASADQQAAADAKPQESAVICKSKFSDLLQTFKKSKKNKEKKKKR